MTPRKPLSKRVRFEVFKRDSFKCQYCGASAPDVLLHIDHIKAVANGGTNEIGNLVTACDNCNLGKGARPLDENAAVAKSRAQAEALQDRREQLQMMMEWQEGLRDLQEQTVDQLARHWSKLVSPFSLTDAGTATLRVWVRKHSAEDLISAMSESVNSYVKTEGGKVTPESIETAWEKIPAIIGVLKASKSKPYMRELFYARGILRRRLGPIGADYYALTWMEQAHKAGLPLQRIKDIACTLRADGNWLDALFSTLQEEVDHLQDGEIADLERDIEVDRSQLNTLRSELAEIQSKISDAKQQAWIDSFDAPYDNQYQELSDICRAIRRNETTRRARANGNY